MKVIGVIPARWQSSRFPGKMLADILGKSLIRRTFENAKQCSSLEALVVATDDKRIFDHVHAFGGKAFMTSSNCPTGTDRVGEVIEREFPDAEIVVNIQGDEPCLNPSVINVLVDLLRSKKEALVTTPITEIHAPHLIHSPSVVKCAFDKEGKALYFSRSPIPYRQKKGAEARYYRHLGVYCFKRSFLSEYVRLPKTPLQMIEDLEHLKILEHGYPIHTAIVDEEGVGVDTPEDLKLVENILCQKESIFSSQEELSPPLVRG